MASRWRSPAAASSSVTRSPRAATRRARRSSRWPSRWPRPTSRTSALELVTTPVPEPTVGGEPVAAGGDAGVVMRVRDVVVRYGPHLALDGVSLELRRGEILGLLGPNGAGKSTLIRRLAGLLPSRAGTVELDGADPGTSRAARSHIGYLPEEPALYPEETALGYVMYM